MHFDDFKDFIAGEYPELRDNPGLLEDMADNLENAALDWVHAHRREYVPDDRVGVTCVLSVLDELDSVLNDSGYCFKASDKHELMSLRDGREVWVTKQTFAEVFAGYPTWYRSLWNAAVNEHVKEWDLANMTAAQILAKY